MATIREVEGWGETWAILSRPHQLPILRVRYGALCDDDDEAEPTADDLRNHARALLALADEYERLAALPPDSWPDEPPPERLPWPYWVSRTALPADHDDDEEG